MFGKRWRLFRLLGIPLSVDVSWLLILALLTLSFAEGFPAILHEYFPRGPGFVETPTDCTGSWRPDHGPLAFFSLHRPARSSGFTALVARGTGNAHQRNHPVPIRRSLGIGGSKPPSAATEFLMAVAGPLVSAVLAVLFGFVAVLGYRNGWPHPVVLVLGYLALDQRGRVDFQPDPRIPRSTAVACSAFHPLGSDWEPAAGDALGLLCRSSLRLGADRLGRMAVLQSQLDRRNLECLDWHVSERRGQERLSASAHSAGRASRVSQCAVS